MIFLSIIKVKIMVLIKWSYKSPPPIPNYIDYWTYHGYHVYQHMVQSPSNTSFWCFFLEPH